MTQAVSVNRTMQPNRTKVAQGRHFRYAEAGPGQVPIWRISVEFDMAGSRADTWISVQREL